MTANTTQVGGAHYKAVYQHWDLVWDAGLGYFPGQITKYTARWRLKNGLQDLQKALHFAQKYLELLNSTLWSTAPTNVSQVLLDRFFDANPQATGQKERYIITLLTRTHGINEVTRAVDALEGLIAAEPSAAYVSQS